MKCASCGNVAPEGASYCPECGVALAVEPAATEAAAAPVPTAEPAATEAPAAEAVGDPAEPIESAADGSAPAAESAAGAPATEAPAPQAELASAPQPVEAPTAAVPAPEPTAAAVPAAEPAAAPVNPYAQPAQPTSQAASTNQTNQNPYAQPTQSATSTNAWAASQQAANPYAQPQQPYGRPQGAPVGGNPGAACGQVYYTEGCISAALADIRGSKNWFGRALVLGLINCVPVLNFFSQGYLLNWSREVPFGGKTQMPKKYFSGKNFEIGFYFFLISLVFALVVGIASAVIGWIPLIGWFAALALSFGASMFVQACSMRMAMMQQLGDGFSIGKVWQMIKRNWTGLFCAAVVPGIVAGLVISVIALIAMFLGLGAVVPVAMMDPYSYGSSAVAGMLGALGVVGVLAMLAIMVLCLVVEFFASLVTIRAVAHWVGRYAPEWASEATYRATGYGAAPRS